jgi:hypothetical protein
MRGHGSSLSESVTIPANERLILVSVARILALELGVVDVINYRWGRGMLRIGGVPVDWLRDAKGDDEPIIFGEG